MTDETPAPAERYVDCPLLFQKIVPSYRVPIFRMLHDKLHIVVCHSLAKDDATWQSFHERMDFPNILLKSYFFGWRETNVLQNVLPVLRRFRPRIVISEFSIGYFTFWLLFLLKRIFGYRLIAWTHGIGNREVLSPFRTLRSRIELFVYRRVDCVLLYSEERKRLLERKMDASRLFVASNTMDTESMLRQRKQLAIRGRELVKGDIGFDHQFNIVYIGRLLKDKRIDLLLESHALLAGKIDVALHIVGDGPEMPLVKASQKKQAGIKSYGAIFDEDLLGSYLFASDLIVNPGYVGLSIVHAFSYGTPMVTCRMTQSGPFHSPEIEYLYDGVNGIYCESSAQSIAENVGRVLADAPALRRMSDAALRTAQMECSLVNMLQGFDNALDYLNEKVHG